jgi:vacuolar-type H+-ATPase subunit H
MPPRRIRAAEQRADAAIARAPGERGRNLQAAQELARHSNIDGVQQPRAVAAAHLGAHRTLPRRDRQCGS